MFLPIWNITPFGSTGAMLKPGLVGVISREKDLFVAFANVAGGFGVDSFPEKTRAVAAKIYWTKLAK